MRLARRNQQKMYYSLQTGEVPVYETDEDGNIQYIEIGGNKVPIPTGEKELGYSIPIEFVSSLSMSGGEAEAQAYGLSKEDYDATLICPRNAYPIVEGSLIWVKSEIVYKDELKTLVEPTSADYTVSKCTESLNLVKYILKAIVK
jgi:hypothetical protein